MAAFTALPAPVRICRNRRPMGLDRSYCCCSLTPSMRFAPAAPSALAVAAAALLAAGALHPTALPPAARRGAPPAAVAALLAAVVLRPRTARRRRRDDLDPPRAVVLPPVDGARNSEMTGITDVQSAFSASRREWDAAQPANSPAGTQSDPWPAGSETSSSVSSTVYSYSYGRTRKKKKRSAPPSDEPKRTRGDDNSAGGVGATFSHMREEFLSQPDGESYRSKEDLGPVSFTEEAWEDDGDDDDYAWQGTSDRVAREPRKEGGTDRYFEDEKLPPRPVSAATLIRQVVRAPMWVLSEVVLPVADIVALVWFDFKVWLLGRQERRSREGEDRYFLPELKRKGRFVEKEEEGEGLSHEEMQIRQVQTAAKKVVDGVEGTVRKLFDEFL